jgi:ethanolamine utilization protein EutQ (cupin superfamily)
LEPAAVDCDEESERQPAPPIAAMARKSNTRRLSPVKICPAGQKTGHSKMRAVKRSSLNFACKFEDPTHRVRGLASLLAERDAGKLTASIARVHNN